MVGVFGVLIDRYRRGASALLSRFVFASLCLVAGCSQGVWGNSAGGDAPVGDGSTITVTSASTASRGVALNGNPELLGVTNIDFVTAMFPTSPEEHRISAAWEALKYNVRGKMVEDCMAEAGFDYRRTRYSSMFFQRNGDMQDFELDARIGMLANSIGIDSDEEPPASSSQAEKDAWSAALARCDSRVSESQHESFDYVIGSVALWWDIVRDVNNSAEMATATESMLMCIADAGGPRVETLQDVYLVTDRMVMDGIAAGRDPNSVTVEVAQTIADCAGDYNETRQALLVPIRDRIVEEYAEELAEAEEYFNEMLRLAYED